MTSLLFPVGHYLGTYYLDGADDHIQQVRLGTEIVELSDPELAVWSLAHGLADDAGRGPWDRGRVEAEIVDRGPGDATELIDHLLGRELLAEVEVDGPAAADFARRHRLLPLHMGLGNSARFRTMFAAGTAERPLVGMTGMLYEMWLWSHLAPNLLAACEDQVLFAHKDGGAAPHEPDPRRLLTAALTALHTLLAPNAACLDLAVPGYRP